MVSIELLWWMDVTARTLKEKTDTRILGHCRRRKIRCIPAAGDPQNRCSNCIRLKKECNFYPVDQNPQPESRRKDSKAQSGTGRASESSSPSTSSGQLPEIQSTLPYPHHLNMPPIQDLGGPQMKRQRTESFSPETKGLNPYQFSEIIVLTMKQWSHHLAIMIIATVLLIGWHLMLLQARSLKQSFPNLSGG